MNVCHVYTVHSQQPQRTEEGIKLPKTVGTYSYEPPYGCWKSRVFKKKQSVLLTTELSRWHYINMHTSKFSFCKKLEMLAELSVLF